MKSKHLAIVMPGSLISQSTEGEHALSEGGRLQGLNSKSGSRVFV